MKASPCMIVLLLFCVDASAAVSPLDVAKLKTTNVYSMLPQQSLFVEMQPPRKVAVVPGNAAAIPFAPMLLTVDIVVNSLFSSAEFNEKQATTIPLHGLLDRYQAEPALNQGITDAIHSFEWLHPAKNIWSQEDISAQARLQAPNADADSVLTIELFYSISPDYRGLIITARVKAYSVALSPEKYNAYDPDSKFAWLKQPVAMRTCIYQSKLLNLPEKTPAIVGQLTAAADQVFDATSLKKDVAELNRDPYSFSLTKRTGVVSKMKKYTALNQAIQRQGWGDLDSMLMLGLLWSANDGALYKQAIQEGSSSLRDIIMASISPIPVDAVPAGKDDAGKDSVFIIKQTTDRKLMVTDSGIAISVASGDPIDVGSPLTQ